MIKKLHDFLPTERIKARIIDRYAYASDASPFYLVPKGVVQPINIKEIQKLFEWAHDYNEKLTFRAGGTSLSGQGVTDGILVELSNHWRKVTPENEGKTVRVEPAVIGNHVNISLKKHGQKIGPDPASINAAMMGGILANNASGMCCGVTQNSYHTLKSMTFVLPNGMVFNTEKADDYKRFEVEAKAINDGLQALRIEILENEVLTKKIRKKYKQKNTVGYGLNAFIDFEHSLDILSHLLIGSEGTLGFIAEAVMNTLPDLPHKMTAMLYFDNPETACNAIPALITAGAAALEFMDRASLRSVETMPNMPSILQTLSPTASAILCEFQENTEAALVEKYEKAKPILANLPLLFEANFTQNPKEQAVFWKIRKGLYPSVAAMRGRGTSTILEDLTFPVERLGEAVIDVQQLFKKYNYQNAIVFGHAKDGNLHFIILQNLGNESDIELFAKFNDELFELVLKKYDGALKAEHSTGRAVTPFVEAEWGGDAYQIMKKLKGLIDPQNILNPDIIVSDNKNQHIENLKSLPQVEDEVDKCIECGFCETSCPSRDYTLTPRRRIGLRRAIKRLEQIGDNKTKNAILKDYKFDGLESCAVDGMCATNCPVDINTGDLVKRLRRENHSEFENNVALKVAKNFGFIENTLRFTIKTGVTMNNVFGKNFMLNLTKGMKSIVPSMPMWNNGFRPSAFGTRLSKNNSQFINHHSQIIYFSSCINRMMGGDIFRTFQSVCQKANIHIIIPNNSNGMCCGQVFSSKGFSEAYKLTANETIEKLWQTTKEGAISVVMDVTSCTQTLKSSRQYLTNENKKKFDKIAFLDVIDFAADWLVPKLTINHKKNNVALHPVCSAHKLGTIDKLQQIGQACANVVNIPAFAGCCGMAGDRGFYYPKLTQAATKNEATEVKLQSYDGYYSSSKTCEMALSEAVGKNYESILKLLDEVS